METQYYFKLNSDGSVNRPYSDKDGFAIPEDCIEVSETLLKEYLLWNNKGYVCYYVNGSSLHKVHKAITEANICKLKCKEIRELLANSDTTQLLDNRLTEEKRLEFESYREQLRELLRQLEAKEVTASEAIIPEVPSYEPTT